MATVRHEIPLRDIAVTQEVAEWYAASGIQSTAVRDEDGTPLRVPVFLLKLWEANEREAEMVRAANGDGVLTG